MELCEGEGESICILLEINSDLVRNDKWERISLKEFREGQTLFDNYE